MSSFLEDIILPELVKDTDKDKLESEIISRRKNLDDTFVSENIKSKEPLTEKDYKIIAELVSENSGHKEYSEKREKLLTEYNSDFRFSWGDAANRLSIDPITRLIESNSNRNESKYHYNLEAGKPEILLDKKSRHEMVGSYGYEYTHYTQAISGLDILDLTTDMKDDEKDYVHAIFKTLKEGQALRMAGGIAGLYTVKENDMSYLRYISEYVLEGMEKIYNALECKGKSGALMDSLNINNEISNRDLGITYFVLNNLQPKDFYEEFINWFVK
jgi:hypothetical protein